MKRSIVFFLFAVLLLAACAPQPAARAGSIEIISPWARPAMAMGEGMTSNGAAYMTIRNTGSEADRLVKFETTVAMINEMHETKMDGDHMSMSPIEAIEIPANGSAELKPGGMHLMLMNLKEELKPGMKIQITLTFEKAGTVQFEAEVKEN